MPRLFTGIEIPPVQRTQLSMLQSGLKNTRWIDPADFHITLQFIGDVTVKTANELVEALSLRQWAAPTIKLGELASFGNSKPRAVYASVERDENLSRLAAGQERLLQQMGLEPQHRQFTPHVTLARLRGGTDVQQVADYLGQRGGFSAPAFTPSRFVLYSARDSTGGGPYQVETGWTFQNDMP